MTEELKKISEVLREVVGEKLFNNAHFQEEDLNRLLRFSKYKKSSNIEEHIFWKNLFADYPKLIFSKENH